MKRISGAFVAAGLLALLAAGSGRAQFANPSVNRPPAPRQYTTPPPISPYLNLLRPGASTANNYFNLVRPQFQAESNFTALNQQVTANQRSIAGLQSGQAGDLGSGHRTQFMNLGGHFMNLGSGQGGGGGASAGAGLSGLQSALQASGSQSAAPSRGARGRGGR